VHDFDQSINHVRRYDEVQSNVKREWALDRAKIILDMEALSEDWLLPRSARHCAIPCKHTHTHGLQGWMVDVLSQGEQTPLEPMLPLWW
jgi:hypothetical protein